MSSARVQDMTKRVMILSVRDARPDFKPGGLGANPRRSIASQNGWVAHRQSV